MGSPRGDEGTLQIAEERGLEGVSCFPVTALLWAVGGSFREADVVQETFQCAVQKGNTLPSWCPASTVRETVGATA